MKQFFKILLACFSAFILFFIIVALFLFSFSLGSGDNSETVLKNSVLTIDLGDVMAEQGNTNPFGFLSGEASSTMGLNEVLKSIEDAKTNKDIKGIYIKLGICQNGWASLHQVREALLDFKTSKKFVVAYGEICDQKSYYVASAGTKIFMNPVGGLEFKGLAVNGTFYKGAIDKLDIKTEAFHCGKYKSAHEPYSMEKFSDANREQLRNLIGDFYGEFLMAVSQKSGLDTATLNQMANSAMVKFPKDAMQQRMIDGVLFSDSVENYMRHEMALKEKDKIHFISPDSYASTIDEDNDANDKIAVLYADGAIYDGDSKEEIFSKRYTKIIRKIAKDDDIKAVVLRINSPGGSALASEVLFHELEELRKKKPVIASMGNYAASGGYYLSCAADSIYADKNTLTGSIGVVGVLFNLTDMMKNKLGVTTDQVKTGPYADFPNMTRTMSDAERNWIQSYLDSTYILFKTRVANARRLTMDQVEELAQGHVYSGKAAKDLKLIDAFGSLKNAIASASKKAKLDSYSIVEYPQKSDDIDDIMSSISGKKREDAAMKRILGDDYVMYQEIQKIKSRQNQIQMAMPWLLDIK